MKKIFIFTLLASFSLLACTKEGADTEGGKGNLKQVVFNAKAYEPKTEVSQDSKTVIQDDNKVWWEENDMITILWGSEESERTTSAAESAGATTTFTASVGAADNYYAVHPSSISVSFVSTGQLKLNVPKTQRGAFDKANITLAKTTQDERNFSFKNLCAVIKLTVSRNDIKQVAFTGNNNESVVGDNIDVSLIGEIPEITNVRTPRIQTNLESSSGTLAPGDYYIAILPGTFTSGFKFKCTLANGRVLSAKSTPKEFTFNRGDVVTVGVIDDVPEKILYVTTDGTGDGSSWSSSLNFGSLAELLSTDDAASISKLNGSIIRFAGGTYALPDGGGVVNIAYSSKCVATFEGGWDSVQETRDPANQTTAIDGNGANPIFTLGSNVNFAFDGITFQNAQSIPDDLTTRGAIFVKASSAKIEINNCKFLNNIESGTSTSGNEGGAALLLTDGKVYVKNTLFKDNSSGSRGGAIRADGTNAVLFLYNCKFIGNSLNRESYGTSIFAKCNLGMSTCTFNGGSAQDGKNNPAVNLNNNYILSDNNFAENACYGSGTGVIRSETDGNYAGLFINNIVVNTYFDTSKAFGLLISKTTKKAKSAGYNVFAGKDNGISHDLRFDLQTTDYTAKDYKTLGPTGYTVDPITYEITWTDGWTEYTKADENVVSAAISQYTTEAGVTTLGSDFLDWLSTCK